MDYFTSDTWQDEMVRVVVRTYSGAKDDVAIGDDQLKIYAKKGDTDGYVNSQG